MQSYLQRDEKTAHIMRGYHDKNNNNIKNLELITHKENLKKAVKHHGNWGFLKEYAS